ncbi:MAG: helix-turn-helix domain-containing protein [Clostridiales bacterium]|jgi:DNA-binding XRE family transcriptional regulator/desulfoferrodoxin (superoxide reductase-like protein)|nr:helix-turn-helix domain-containing protein [Clostridiales bacterium]
MDQYVTGEAIRTLREKAGFTQAELASKICVSDKTVSKWETGKGYPDISLLEPLSEALHVSITELLSGNLITNNNVSANMLRSKFYVCPVCGNIIHGTGESVVQCNGVTLVPEEPAKPDDKHFIRVERVEDEYFVSVDHEMTKQHYISFIAAVSDDGIQLKKIYPESAAEARFRIEGVRKFYCYCNRDGLFGL